MVFHQPNPGGYGAALQVKLLAYRKPDKVLHDTQHRIGGGAIGNAGIAVSAHVCIDPVRAEFKPELIIAHRLKPFFNILYIFEIFHTLRLPQTDSATQFLNQTYPHDKTRFLCMKMTVRPCLRRKPTATRSKVPSRTRGLER